MTDKLRALGSETDYLYNEPTASILETFPNPFWVDNGENPNQVGGKVDIRVPEFTTLCPKTGQPDYAVIMINYVPRAVCVESKSLKLYLGAYRMFGTFHEACVNKIMNDFIEAVEPIRVEVQGQFTPRGGIPFWPHAVWVHPDMRQQQPSQILVPGVAH